MKLGVLQFLPPTFDELTPELLRQLRALGFSGTGLPAGDDPATVSTDRARAIGAMFQEAEVSLVEYGRYSTDLVSPDPENRARNVAGLRQAFRVARAAGCPAVITGSGSLSPHGPWMPHPDNFLPETADRLIATLKEAVKGAEDEGVVLGLECHTVTALRDARTTRDILDAVGSPALKVHLDPVNWMTWETVYQSGAATEAMFDTLRPERLLGAHSKGVTVEPRLIIHISETVTGAPDDIFDHAALLRRGALMPPDFWMVIEHLSREQMPAARDHLLKVADRLGVSFI
jgi:sugar phosphate isomerase/epimerase